MFCYVTAIGRGIRHGSYASRCPQSEFTSLRFLRNRLSRHRSIVHTCWYSSRCCSFPCASSAAILSTISDIVYRYDENHQYRDSHPLINCYQHKVVRCVSHHCKRDNKGAEQQGHLNVVQVGRSFPHTCCWKLCNYHNQSAGDDPPALRQDYHFHQKLQAKQYHGRTPNAYVFVILLPKKEA